MARGSLRDELKGLVRDRVSRVTVELSYELGFDNVTVAQIAAAASISPRTFNRYYPSKEDAALGDILAVGAGVRDALAARPEDEPIWASLHAAFHSILADSADQELGRKRAAVLIGTPSLRGRHLQRRLAWVDYLEPIVAERITGPDREIRAKAIVNAAIMCWDVTMVVWVREEPSASGEALLRSAFSALSAHG